jgi:S1-C subfamily serine protease/Tfp pilus assembly protein PilF
VISPGISSLLILVALLAGCAHRQEAYLERFGGTVLEKPDLDPLVRIGRASLVTVEALDSSGRVRGFGTGFLVGNTSVATCLHVIESAVQLRVVLADGSARPVDALHGVDPLMDLAVLSFSGIPAPFPVLPLAAAPPLADATVTGLASPRHLAVSATRGKVLASQDLAGGLYNDAILLNVPASPGFSGGPVIDSNGAAVGMMSEIRTRRSGSVLVAVPVSEVRRLLRSPAIPREEWLRRNPQPPFEAARRVAQAEALGAANPGQRQVLLDGALKLFPNYPRALARKASLLLETGRPLLAEEAYRKLEEIEPDLVATRLERSICFVQARMPERSLELAEELVRLRPESPSALNWLAFCRAAQRDRLGGMDAALQALRIAPHQFTPNLTAGCIWDTLGCHESARIWLSKATRLQPGAGFAWLRLGLLEWKTGRTNEAVVCLKKSLEDSSLENPSPAHYLLCLIEWGQGDFKSARKSFGAFLRSEIARLDPADPFRSRSADPLAEIQALSWYKRLREKDWNRLDTHLQISEILIRSKADDLLRPVLETTVWLGPDTADLWAKLAIVANATGDFERGQEAARRALALKPYHPHAHWCLGFSQCALGNRMEGRKSLENSIVLHPRLAPALEALAALDEMEGDHPAALRHLNEALRASPTTVPFARLPFVIPDARLIRAKALQTP